ncbi:hypothetical protein [Pectinatus sottacetonis]|uniref:hypothetical protein n=1 Tax=Pectinatus sottacetonis TaxID=1002795 RepID=UPI0018C4F1E0|nr:hypothetical protein [Pectinatus sottacetonis]
MKKLFITLAAVLAISAASLTAFAAANAFPDNTPNKAAVGVQEENGAHFCGGYYGNGHHDRDDHDTCWN